MEISPFVSQPPGSDHVQIMENPSCFATPNTNGDFSIETHYNYHVRISTLEEITRKMNQNAQFVPLMYLRGPKHVTVKIHLRAWSIVM